MLRLKGQAAEFVSLVDEMEGLVEKSLRPGGGLSALEQERLSEIERQLTQLISYPDRVDERRRGMRLTCRVRVRLRAMGEEREAWLLDLGSGGVFVHTELALAKGTELELVVDQGLGSLPRGTTLRGAVAWVGTGADMRNGIGVAFKNTDRTTDARVRALLIELLRQQSSAI